MVQTRLFDSIFPFRITEVGGVDCLARSREGAKEEWMRADGFRRSLGAHSGLFREAAFRPSPVPSKIQI